MHLSDYIKEDSIALKLESSNKQETLRELCEILQKTAVIKNTEKIVALLEERERLSTTGIGFGVAVPHCKSVDVDDLKIVVGRSEQGVDFQSLDGKPVNLIFLLIAPEQSSSLHLKALAKIARFAKDSEIRQSLLEYKTAAEICQFIRNKDEDIN
ncbi:MAG: PTS sugar transporter subunit IIA [Deltaproteobacteria bacterium]|nr:PTS sugar transporter subunit IIA [Deltaproteobacteria bacterium]